jgi:hypothetical protein
MVLDARRKWNVPRVFQTRSTASHAVAAAEWITVTDALTFVAVITASLFAGAALYISIAEHPARMLIDTRSAVSQWAASYKRATWMQAPLAAVSFLAGAALWFTGNGVAWLMAAALIGAVVPFTFIGIMPTNNRLLSGSVDPDSHEARGLLVRWGHLHAVRTLLSVCAAALYAWLIVRA